MGLRLLPSVRDIPANPGQSRPGLRGIPHVRARAALPTPRPSRPRREGPRSRLAGGSGHRGLRPGQLLPAPRRRKCGLQVAALVQSHSDVRLHPNGGGPSGALAPVPLPSGSRAGSRALGTGGTNWGPLAECRPGTRVRRRSAPGDRRRCSAPGPLPAGPGGPGGPFPGAGPRGRPQCPVGLTSSAPTRPDAGKLPEGRLDLAPTSGPTFSPAPTHPTVPRAPHRPPHAPNSLKDVLRRPNLHGVGGPHAVPRRKEAKRPHRPPPCPLASSPPRRPRSAHAPSGPTPGRPDAEPRALSRPGTPGSARGATKPRPLAPGARVGAVRTAPGAAPAVVLRRRGPPPRGSADLWAELGPAQRVPGRSGRLLPAPSTVTWRASRGPLTGAVSRRSRTGCRVHLSSQCSWRP